MSKPNTTTKPTRQPPRATTRNLADLHEFPGNPRLGNLDAIAASLDELGQVERLVILGTPAGALPAGTILGGNNRRRAMIEKLGLPPEHPVDVEELDGLTEDEARKVNAYLNRTGDLASYGPGLDEFLASIPDLSAAVFSDDYLASLATPPELPAPRSDVDDAPAPVEEGGETVCEEGDVWLLGPHRLVVGDCTSPEIVGRLMQGERADLVLTDPPYCSGGFQESSRAVGSIGSERVNRSGEGPKRLQPTIANDNLSTRGYVALMRDALGIAPADLAFVFTDWRMWSTLFDVVEARGFGVRSMIVWDKGTPGMGRVWRSQHELVMWSVRAKLDGFSNHDAIGNVITLGRRGNPLHPTQKPVELLTELLRPLSSVDIRSIYDPFAGSGSILIACHALGKVARMVELKPRYADTIARRWQEHTGEVPTLQRAGKGRGKRHEFGGGS